ncbi:terminase small subunit [bacterium]|nr:terminase small subunit [bacterium]
MSNNRPLNDKQLRFIDEYMIDLHVTNAAIRAGYAQKSAHVQGSVLLKHPKVAAELARRQAARAERVGVTQDYVLTVVLDTIERCRQASPVLDRKGEHVLVSTPSGEIAPAYAFDAPGVYRGAELLAKHLGMYGEDNRQKTDPIRDLIDAVARSDAGRSVLDGVRQRTHGGDDGDDDDGNQFGRDR